LVKKINILPIGNVEGNLILRLKNKTENLFKVAVSILKTEKEPVYAYDPLRQQYNSTKILKTMLKTAEDETKTIGITDVDLFIQILTFVFGEAQLGGKVAVVSTARLKQEFYGMPVNKAILEERLIKEFFHELGHTYGLIHCENPLCVMRLSTNIKQVDLKSGDFCQNCKIILKI